MVLLEQGALLLGGSMAVARQPFLPIQPLFLDDLFEPFTLDWPQ